MHLSGYPITWRGALTLWIDEAIFIRTLLCWSGGNRNSSSREKWRPLFHVIRSEYKYVINKRYRNRRAIKNGPSRKSDNISYTKHMTMTNKYLSMIFSRFKQTFGRKPKGLSGMDNPVTQETLVTKDIGQSKRVIFDSQGLRSALLIFSLGIARRIFVILAHCHLLDFDSYAPCNNVIFSQSTRVFHFLSFERPENWLEIIIWLIFKRRFVKNLI